MIQSFAKTGWVGLLSISLCLQMAWAGPFDRCECVQSSTQSGRPSCVGCQAQATPKPDSARFAVSTSSSCCCSPSGPRAAIGSEPASPESDTDSWTQPGCDCGLHSSLPATPGVTSKPTLSPRGPQHTMMPSAESWQLTRPSQSIRLISTRSNGPPRHFSQTLLCVWLI